MKKVLHNEKVWIITPEEGHYLALRGDKTGRTASELIIPVSSNLLDKVFEVVNTKEPVYVPDYSIEQKNLELAELKQYIISQSKVLLESYLEKNPVKINNEFYNASTKAQANLLAMIKAGEMAQEVGIDFSLTWAPIGGVQQEYTLHDLKRIFVEIQLYVHKFVLQQQLKEQEILSISSKEELLNLDINYHAETN